MRQIGSSLIQFLIGLQVIKFLKKFNLGSLLTSISGTFGHDIIKGGSQLKYSLYFNSKQHFFFSFLVGLLVDGLISSDLASFVY